MFLPFYLFAFILALGFLLLIFSRLFCDVQSLTKVLFFIIFDCHQFWDSYADYLCILCLELFHNIWLL